MARFDLPDRYTKPRFLDSGGQSQVFIYFDRYLEREVAVKFSRHSRDHKQEVVMIGQVQSPHIIQLYDIYTSPDHNSMAVVQEYLSGPELSGESESYEDDYCALYQLACGLTAIHRQNIIHRDIKPKNAKFDAESILKIFDFGFSHAIDRTYSLAARGTDGYRAPEVVTGQSPISQASDIYSFGATAWYIFGGELHRALLEHPEHRTKSRPLFKDHFSSVEPQVAELMEACLSWQPEERPTAQQCQLVLENVLLRGRHKAVALDGSGFTVIESIGHVKINSGTGYVVIHYDGYSFKVQELVGEVLFNNKALSVGDKILGCGVFTFSSGQGRQFMNFDTSHPNLRM